MVLYFSKHIFFTIADVIAVVLIKYHGLGQTTITDTGWAWKVVR